MADNEEKTQPEEKKAKKADEPQAELPAHLRPEHFAEDAKVPGFMQHPNWMNVPDAGEVVHVRFPDGAYHRTTNGIHLGKWVLQEHAQIIPAPKEE